MLLKNQDFVQNQDIHNILHIFTNNQRFGTKKGYTCQTAKNDKLNCSYCTAICTIFIFLVLQK